MERVKPSILKIVTNAGTGSGFIYNVNGQTASVITNRHVVEGATSIQAVYEGSTFQAQYVSTDPARDLAVIEVCCSTSFKALRIAYWGDAKLGTEVYALGYPLGLGTVRVTAGLVSGLDYYADADEHWIQTDAALNPGNSGGPLVMLSGEVAGVNFGGLRYDSNGQPLEGFGFAISARTIDAALPDMESTLRAVAAPSPTATAPAKREFYKDRVDLPHDEGDGQLERYIVWEDADRFSIWAEFEVPYGPEVGAWDSGYMFRYENGSTGWTGWRIYVHSNGWWNLTLHSNDGNSEKFEKRADGWLSDLSNLSTNPGESNRLQLTVTGNRGVFRVNWELVATVDLSGGPESGLLEAAIGFNTGTEVDGFTTTIWGLGATNLED